jgi:L-aminopeptidase/D-esterase-like protein
MIMPPAPSLTRVDGIWVGHYTLRKRPTGCTVICGPKPFVAAVDVRGGAPGTRETDLLSPENSVDQVDAIFLSGGSAFGLDVGTGVSRYLEEQGRGFNAEVARVPVVCGAILFDLWLGDPKIRPDARAGYQAIRSANGGAVPEGNVGAGAGATVGKMMGRERAMKGGLGSWAIERPDGLTVGALSVVNSIGDVVDPNTGKIIAGARREDGGFIDVGEEIRKGYRPGSPFQGNTIIGVVATNAVLTKAHCRKVAQMAHDGLARCIRPAHMPWDGDTIFAVSTCAWKPKRGVDPGIIGALAADAFAASIVRGVSHAKSWGPYPAAGDAGRRIQDH